MKIERIDIEGFGHFTDMQFGPFDPTLAVILGENEAGKSTLLAFIRTMLFGFPAQRRAQWYPALNGGRHGGRIVLVDYAGVQYTIERSEDTHGATFKVTTVGYQGSDESMLAPLIGNCSQEVFKAVFAFGLLDLQNISALNKSDASAQIYAAGMGAGSLPAALKKLDAERDAIFLKSGSNQQAAKILAQLREIDAELDASKGQAAEYARLTQRSAELEVELDAAKTDVADISARLTELSHLEQAWTYWLSLNEAQATLRELPPQPGFPEDGLARLDKFETAVSAAVRAHGEAADKYESNSARASAPITGEALLALGDRIDEIRRGSNSFDASVKDLPKRHVEVAALERELADTIRDLGPDWTEERVLAFDTSIPAHDPIEQWRTRLDDAERNAREAKLALEHASEAVRAAAESEEKALLALKSRPAPAMDKAELDASRVALRASKQALAEYQRASDRRVDAEGRAAQVPIIVPPAAVMPPSNLPAYMLMGAGALSLVGGVSLGGSGLVLGLVLGLLLLGAGGFLRFVHQPTVAAPLAIAATAVPPVDAHLEGLRTLEASLRATLVTVAALFGRGIPTAADLDSVESNLIAAETALRDIDTAQQHWQQAHDERERLAARAADATSNLESAVAARKGTNAEWAAWLTRLGLDSSLTPGTVLALIARIDTARTQLHALHDPRERPGKIQQDIDRYATLVEQLATQFDVPFEHGRSNSVAEAADRLISEYDNAHKASIVRDSLRESLKQDAEALDRLLRRVSEAESELAALLALGNSDDAEAFRHNARAHARCMAAEEQLAAAERHIRTISGPGERYEALLATLTHTDPATLDAEQSRLDVEKEAASDTHNQLRDERVEIKLRLDDLASDEQLSAKRAERAVLVEQLEECGQRWSAFTLARAMLARARKKYEEERQPDVLKNAQEFFFTITGGRYDRVMSPLDTHVISVRTANGATRDADKLSQGTLDQLYLALRFGLVREFGARAAHLPVVVDDILVNFDPNRALRAAQAFTQLSSTNQVIVFTCQPATAQLFQQANPNTQVIDLNETITGSTPRLSPATVPLFSLAPPH